MPSTCWLYGLLWWKVSIMASARWLFFSMDGCWEVHIKLVGSVIKILFSDASGWTSPLGLMKTDYLLVDCIRWMMFTVAAANSHWAGALWVSNLSYDFTLFISVDHHVNAMCKHGHPRRGKLEDWLVAMPALCFLPKAHWSVPLSFFFYALIQ